MIYEPIEKIPERSAERAAFRSASHSNLEGMSIVQKYAGAADRAHEPKYSSDNQDKDSVECSIGGRREGSEFQSIVALLPGMPLEELC